MNYTLREQLDYLKPLYLNNPEASELIHYIADSLCALNLMVQDKERSKELRLYYHQKHLN